MSWVWSPSWCSSSLFSSVPPVPARAGPGGTQEGPLVGFAQGLQEAEGRNSDTEEQKLKPQGRGHDSLPGGGPRRGGRPRSCGRGGQAAGAARPCEGIKQSTGLREFFGRTVVLGPGPSQAAAEAAWGGTAGPREPWHLHCQLRAQRAAIGCEHSPDAHKGAATKG